jgi:primase-polymerase (primpol)-like protein
MSILRESIPIELTEREQWVLWRYQDRDGNLTKVPHTCMGYKADVTNPAHWSKFEDALKFASRPGFAAGVGFAFNADDPYCGIDLDNCYPNDAAACAPWAAGILEKFANTYQEVSPSGTGVKIWCRARAPRCGKWPIGDGAIEIYDRARFFTVTGRSSGTSAIVDHQSDIEALVARLDGGRNHRAPARTIPEIIPQGRRHNTLVSLAGTMYRRGMTPEAIEAALEITNERQCDPPYAPEHVHKIIESMQRWGR